MVGGGGGGPLRRVGKYEVGRTIGEGTFAKVKFAQNTETGESVAMKVLDRSSILKNKMAEQVTKLASFFFARWVGTWDVAGSRAAPASPPNNVDGLGWIALPSCWDFNPCYAISVDEFLLAFKRCHRCFANCCTMPASASFASSSKH
ncbi:CBL-interacting serine/threonine-protein kinase 8 [Zea mays]|jgi:serine/threonine protein kinase|nr:CBL-interacting serine/threonine-protein kinase 8 [Zea mays]